jgi:hypothetical protein
MSKLMSALLLFLAAPAMAQSLTANDRAEIVANAASLIEQRYVDAAKARTIAASLRKHGRNWTTTDPEAFAEEVTEWLRRTTGDGHLGLSYSKDPIPEGAGEANFSAAEMEKWYGPQLNHGIEKIERLPGNIMLLDLRVFPPPAMAGDVFAAALSVVAQGDALIIDLRNNAGGMETSRLLMGYLLEGGQPLSGEYNRPANRHSAGVSPDWVPGRRFGSAKPVFVLTSRKTFSAAEAVAYDLQALKRATIVGETTGGGAHPFEYRRIHPHFAVDLPEGRSINPITGGNWQDVGVKPDVAVPADQALDVALKLARDAIARGRSASGSDPRSPL